VKEISLLSVKNIDNEGNWLYIISKIILLEGDMSIIEVTSLSTKGQIVIPNDIRESMNLNPGTKLIIIQEGDNILLKPIKTPDLSQFENLIALGDQVREELNLTEADVSEAIKAVRQK